MPCRACRCAEIAGWSLLGKAMTRYVTVGNAALGCAGGAAHTGHVACMPLRS